MPIGQKHANTAFTFSCKPSNEINIFRYEEWFKVLIHESFHSMGLDFSQFNQTKTNRCILDMFPVKSDVRLFETYCESWAEMINVMFIVLFESNFKKNKENSSSLMKQTHEYLYVETLFSMFQCSKVLHHFGLDYKTMCEKTATADKKRKSRYREETQILSYYVLKPICMFYMDDFIQWCVKHNGEKVLDFGKGDNLDKNMGDYCGFFRDHYLDMQYVNIMEEIENLVSKSVTNSDFNFEMETLRMTILG